MPKIEIELDNGNKKIVEFDDNFTDDDIDYVRNQLNSENKPINNTPAQKSQPKIETSKSEELKAETEQPTVLQGNVSKNYSMQKDNNGNYRLADERGYVQNWDEKGRVYFTDLNGNKIKSNVPLGTKIWNWGVAKADNIGNYLNAYSNDPNGNAPVDKMYRQKQKDVAKAVIIGATLPVGGAVASRLGLTGFGNAALSGAIDGGIYGLSSGLIEGKDAKGVLGETALNAGLGGVIGLGLGAATPYVKKVVNFLGEKASPVIKNVAEKLGNKIDKNINIGEISNNPKINKNFNNELDNLLNPKDNIVNPNKRKAIIGEVSDETLKIAQENNVDLTGYKHIIDNGGKNHIKTGHSNKEIEISRDQLPITDKDFQNIPEIIYNPDNVEFIPGTTKKPIRFRYSKQMDDGTIKYIEFVANKKKQLIAKTMYKKTRANYAEQNVPHLHTSETHPSNNIITQNAENFKPLATDSAKIRQGYTSLLDEDISYANESEFWDAINKEVEAGRMSLEDAEKIENYAAQITKAKEPVIPSDEELKNDAFKGLKTKIANEKKESRKQAVSVLETITGKRLNKSTINSKNNVKLLETKAVGDEVTTLTPEKAREIFPGIDIDDVHSQEEIINLLKDIIDNGGYSQTENEVKTALRISQNAYGEAANNWESQVHKLFSSETELNKFLDDIKYRGLSQSITKAKGLPKEIKDIISKDLPQYRVLHNNDLTKRAVEEVEKDFNNELSRLTSANEFEALDYEKSRQISKRLFDAGRYKEAINLIDNVSVNATKKGQAIQALSLWSNMSPEGAVYKAEKLITQFNKKYPKRKDIHLSPEQINHIRELQNEVLSATDDVAKAQGSARVAKYISELVPSNLGNKLKAYRNISLLLNPKTLGRNIIGNALFNTVDTVSKGLAVPFDRAIGLVTKNNTRVMPQLKEMAKGGIQGAKTGFKEALEGIDTRGLGQRFDLNSGRVFRNPIGQTFETALDVGLRVPDRMQYEATLAESIANMTKAQGLTQPTQEMLEQAEKEALESVFQNDSVLSNLTLKLRKGLNTIGLKDFGLGDMLVPYAQTPANLAQQGINYSPLGYLKGLGNIAQGNQRQASLDLARATLGTGLMGGGYLLGKNEIATPSQFDDSYTTNRDIKNNLQILGIRPDQIGDMWYAPFQPMSIPLATGIASAYGENPMQAGLNTMLDLPFLQNLSRGISDIKDKGLAEAGINFTGSVPAQFVPTALGQVAQVIDPYQRETTANNKILQGLNQARVKIPFASTTLPEKIDVTGKPIERYPTKGAQKLFDIFINPTFINKKTSDPIVSELKNLYDETKETKHFLLTANKTLNRIYDENGKPLKLNGKQLSDYQKELGEKTYEEFDYTMGSEEYKNADSEEKIKILNDKRNTVKQLVEFEMFNKPISKSYKNKVKKLYINTD